MDVKTTAAVQDAAGNHLPGTGFTAGASYTLSRTVPTVTVSPITPNPRSTPVVSVAFAFSEAVTGFTLANVQLKADGSANLLTGAQTLTTTDNVNWTLGNLAGLTDPTGRVAVFSLALSPAGIANGAGIGLAAGIATSFTVFDPALSLQGQTLTVPGTPGNDTYTFTAGAPHQVTLNGVAYTVSPAAVTAVNFQGNGGTDSATLRATG